MKSRVYLSLLALCALLLTAACGGKHKDSAATTANVRVVNLTKVASLTLTGTNSAANSTAVTIASGIAANSASSYVAVTAGNTSLVASVAGGTLTASNSSGIGLTASSYYTVVAYQRNDTINLYSMIDNQTAPASGFALLNISNPASDAGPLDVYVVPVGTVVDSTVTPKFQNVPSGSFSLTQSIAKGSYDVVVTAYNRPADVRLKIPAFGLVDQEIATLMLTNTAGGALVDGTLIQQNTSTAQGGSITAYANTMARIRLVGAFSQLFETDYAATGPAVQGGTPLSYNDTLISNGIGANGYKSVAAGTTIQAVNFSLPTVTAIQAVGVNASAACPAAHCYATPLALSTPLVAGNEYTLLVYGDTAAPSVQLIADNNQAPAQARIRLINVVSFTGNQSFNVINLYNSSVQLFPQPVQFEQTSSYAGLTTGTSHLNAQVEALTNPFVTIQDGKNIALGGVYTLVMAGSATAFTSALILDRCLPTIQC